MLSIGLITAQTQSIFPVWLTPVWILGLGIAAGLVAVLAFYMLLGGLSKIPALGNLADDRRASSVAALGLSAVFSAMAIAFVMFRGEEAAGYVILPCVCLGLVLGWGVVYGLWHRTFSELLSIFTEGVLGIVILTLGSVAVLGLCATPLISDRNAIIESLPLVLNSETATRSVEIAGSPGDVSADEAPFQRIDGFEYDADAMTKVTVESDRTIIIADADQPSEFTMSPHRVDSGTPSVWRKNREDYETASNLPVPLDPSNGIYIQNREIDPATVVITIVSKPPAPEAITAWVTAATIFLLVFGFVTLRQAAPQVDPSPRSIP